MIFEIFFFPGLSSYKETASISTMEDIQIDATQVPADPILTAPCSPEIANSQFISDETVELEIGDTSLDDCYDSLGDSMVCDPNSRLVPTGFTKPNRTGSFFSLSISILQSVLIFFSCISFSLRETSDSITRLLVNP